MQKQKLKKKLKVMTTFKKLKITSSDKKTVYTVQRLELMDVCTCPAFKFREKYKHLAYLDKKKLF